MSPKISLVANPSAMGRTTPGTIDAELMHAGARIEALARGIGDKAEAACRRGDLFESRRRPMAEWEGHFNTSLWDHAAVRWLSAVNAHRNLG